jgi:hypothetical protein
MGMCDASRQRDGGTAKNFFAREREAPNQSDASYTTLAKSAPGNLTEIVGVRQFGHVRVVFPFGNTSQ